MTLLRREIGMVPVTRLSQDKFTMRNICASKKRNKPCMTLTWQTASSRPSFLRAMRGEPKSKIMQICLQSILKRGRIRCFDTQGKTSMRILHQTPTGNHKENCLFQKVSCASVVCCFMKDRFRHGRFHKRNRRILRLDFSWFLCQIWERYLPKYVIFLTDIRNRLNCKMESKAQI